MAQRGHVAVPHELTRTHACAYVAGMINRVKHIGPTSIVGPREW